MTDDTQPDQLICHWFEEADGTRWLIPGCMGRLFDADEECTCGTLAQKVADLEVDLARTRKAHNALQEWNDAIASAVNAHPDGRDIMQKAARAIDKRHRKPNA